MRSPTRSRLRVTLLSLACLAASGCREGSSNSAAGFIPVVPSPAGTQGCAPTTPVPGALVPVFASAVIGPTSQIAAAAGSETLYLTGADGSIHELFFPGGGAPPTDTVLVAPGVIEASLLVPAGILAPAELSGIALLDAQFLIVAEHASNTLLAVRRDVPDTVQGVAGLPLELGGYADGLAGSIRFHFSAPVALFAAGDGTVFVCDTENHALRLVALGALPQSATVAGNGAPGDGLGALTTTTFDTPSGLASTCPGELLLVESGGAGLGGHRLVSLAIGAPNALFGGFDGSALALAGDGTEATLQGIDTAAQLGRPTGLAATQDGLVFWVDALAGILRRYDFASGLSDCPLFADCAAALLAGGSFSGDHFALAVGASGTLYVLEADAGVLHRVDP